MKQLTDPNLDVIAWDELKMPHRKKVNLFLLLHIRWQFFCTFTFKQNTLSTRRRIDMFFSCMRDVADEFGVYFPKLPWYLRQEEGGKFGRFHFHTVIAGLPEHSVTETTCALISNLWEKHSGGSSKVTIYDPARDGLAYISKCSEKSQYNARFNESAKFGTDGCELMLSHGAWRIALSNAMRQRARLAH